MSKQLCTGTLLQCDKGAIPSPLRATQRGSQLLINNLLIAVTDDHWPMMNIFTFGLCKVTKLPCVPLTFQPWDSEMSSTEFNGFKTLNETSKCQCALGGKITPLVIPHDIMDVSIG